MVWSNLDAKKEREFEITKVRKVSGSVLESQKGKEASEVTLDSQMGKGKVCLNLKLQKGRTRGLGSI